MTKSRKINEIKSINRLFITYINIIIEKLVLHREK